MSRAAVYVLLILAAVSSLPLLAQTTEWAPASDPLVRYIIESERKWVESNCIEQPDLKSIIADDFQGTGPGGKRFAKAEAISTDTSSLDHGCQLDGVKVRYFGEDVAIAYGEERSMHKGDDRRESLRCLVWTDTWLKRNNKWQIISGQDTAVPCN